MRPSATSMLVFFGLSVAGCTGAQMEAQRMQKVGAETVATGKACIEAITENPDYSSLKTKLYLANDLQFPLEMLSDKRLPTKQDIALLYKVHADVQECRKGMLDGAAKMHPMIMLTLVESFAASDKVWAEATDGRMAWGKFNEARKDIMVQQQERMVQANAQITAQLQNQHQFELEQRARAAEAMQQWAYQQQQLAQQQQVVNAMNRPQVINCNYFGSTASCTSH